MKKNLKKIKCLFLCLILTICFQAPLTVSAGTGLAITISEESLKLYPGQTKQLQVLIGNYPDSTAKWSSSNTSIATVSSKGVVTAKKAGKATISGSTKMDWGNCVVKCEVTVSAASLKLSKTSGTLAVGKSGTIKATVQGASKKITWSSSNTSVAVVNSAGKVTAKKAGTAVIYAKANGITRKFSLKVTANVNIDSSLLSASESVGTGKMKQLVSKIGGMKTIVNKNYPDYCAQGNKMAVGINFNPKYSKNQSYVYIRNTGNTNVSFLNMKLGMTVSQAASVLEKSYFSQVNSYEFCYGNAGRLTLNISGNKIKGYMYKCSPTSD